MADVSVVVVLVHWIVEDDFCELHWLGVGHDVIFCLPVLCEENAIATNVSHGTIWRLDDD